MHPLAANHRSSLGFFIVVIAILAAGGASLTSQWQQTMSLRAELEVTRMEAIELAHLRAENKRLREQQISAAELQRLRDDHAALPRLRAELEALNKHFPAVRP